MPDDTSLYAGTDDASLNALYAKLSGGLTPEELSGAVGNAPGSTKIDLGGGIKGSAREAGRHVSLVGAWKYGQRHDAQLSRDRAARKAYNTAASQYQQQRDTRMQQVKDELQRRALKSKVNAYFNSDSMSGLYDTLQNRHLENSLSQITQQYGDQLRNQSFQTAGQGLVGSSVDATRRGDVQQGQNAAAIQAQGAAQQFAQSARDNNEQQRQSLIGTIGDQNPGTGAQFDQQIQAIGNRTSQMGQQYANQTAGTNINQAGNNMQSQALGNLLTNYSNLYRTQQAGYNPNGNFGSSGNGL